MNAVDGEWIVGELSDVDFGDERLNTRLLVTSLLMAANPGASIGAACGRASLCKGAYRMFSNPQVDHEEILSSHQASTLTRIQKEKVVFAIQDTTTLSFPDRDIEKDGFGIVGRNQSMETAGLFLHTTLAVNEAGVPLGIVSQDIFSRKAKPRTSKSVQKKVNSKKTYDEKESTRWVHALEETALLGAERVITLSDREGDIFEFIETGNTAGEEFIVRACRDRNVETGGHISDLLKSSPVQGVREIEVPIKGEYKTRRVELEIRLVKTSILPPKDRKQAQRAEHLGYQPQEVFIVEAKEINPSKRQAPLHWLLLTNIPTHSFEDACARIDEYKLRWNIELFHRILKSGCKVEKMELEHLESIKIALTIYAIIAVRLLELTKAWRATPEAPCTVQLSEIEWRTLLLRVYPTKPLPKRPPSLKTAMWLIAGLGGYCGYENSPRPPGMIVIWRGWQTLKTCTQMWTAFQAQPKAFQMQ